MPKTPIYVTRPDLPSLADFLPSLEAIWQSHWLTNAGPFHQKFEEALRTHLEVEHLALFNNGTMALVVALQALGVKREVITTPYSFVATSHALLWNNLTPVFVDVDPDSGNLDPARVEAAITPNTSALLPVHCYGTPCDPRIDDVAAAHGLKVLYDAAHAFDVRENGRSVLARGDMSILSFHATKVFQTFEGGAIVCKDAATKRHIDFLKNFGFADEVTVTAAGINAKMNEFQAALGLLQLERVKAAIAARREIARRYSDALKNVPGIALFPQRPGVIPNHSYFPILVGPAYGVSRDALYERLKAHNVFSRRYFYPLISNMPMYRDLPSASPGNLPVANRIADRILCLPIYPGLTEEDVSTVIELIARGA